MRRARSPPILRSMTSRTLVAGAVGAFAGAWIGRAAFHWILGFDGAGYLVPVAVLAVAGAVIGVAAERERETPAERPAPPHDG